jgi:hypothetical protein
MSDSVSGPDNQSSPILRKLEEQRLQKLQNEIIEAKTGISGVSSASDSISAASTGDIVTKTIPITTEAPMPQFIATNADLSKLSASITDYTKMVKEIPNQIIQQFPNVAFPTVSVADAMANSSEASNQAAYLNGFAALATIFPAIQNVSALENEAINKFNSLQNTLSQQQLSQFASQINSIVALQQDIQALQSQINDIKSKEKTDKADEAKAQNQLKQLQKQVEQAYNAIEKGGTPSGSFAKALKQIEELKINPPISPPGPYKTASQLISFLNQATSSTPPHTIKLKDGTSQTLTMSYLQKLTNYPIQDALKTYNQATENIQKDQQLIDQEALKIETLTNALNSKNSDLTSALNQLYQALGLSVQIPPSQAEASTDIILKQLQLADKVANMIQGTSAKPPNVEAATLEGLKAMILIQAILTQSSQDSQQALAMQSQNVTKLNLSATEEASRIADKMYTLMIAMGSLQKEINDDNTKAEAAQKAVEALAYTVAALTAAQIAADVFSWVPGVAAVAAVTAVALDLAIAALVAAQVVAAAYTTAAANKTKEYAADEKEMAKDQAEYTLVENTATSFQQIADHLGNSIEGVSQAIQQFSKAINELIDSLVQQTQG